MVPEDQQNINAFAKLNNRKREAEANLQRLKVCSCAFKYERCWIESYQGDKEALDDVSTELELGDEDEPVP